MTNKNIAGDGLNLLNTLMEFPLTGRGLGEFELLP